MTVVPICWGVLKKGGFVQEKTKPPFLSVGKEEAYSPQMAEEKSEFVGTLYQRYWFRLNNVVKKMVRNDDAAADIAQDSFLRINALAEPQQLEYPYAYLCRTALNLIKDRAKARKIRHLYKESIMAEGATNVEILSPEHHAIGREKLRLLSRTIEELPPKCRRVFLLHKVHHLSHKDIAESLGITQHAVEKHVMRALARCQQAFEKEI